MYKRQFECIRDGLTIRGKVYLKDENPRPAVVLCHGFLANMGMCRTYAKLLAELGYAAFIFDFCGGGLMSKSDGKSEEMSVLTEVQDLITVIKKIRTLPFVMQDKVSLLGCSQGGVVSAMVARDKSMDIYKEIKGYEGPVLYLHGTEDRIVDISYARKAGEVFPQREYHEIQGAGHMFRGKADEEACNLISRFMAQ